MANSPEENIALNLRSSASNSSVTRGYHDAASMEANLSRGPITSDSNVGHHSQQVVSPTSQPHVLQVASGSCKPGLELTEPPDSTSYANSRLPHSQFAPSGLEEQLPDHVIIEKQRAKEEYYSHHGNNEPSFPVLESSASCASQNQAYKSNVQETTPLKGGHNRNKLQEDRLISTLSSSSSDTNLLSDVGVLGSSLRSIGPQPASVSHQESGFIPWQEDPRLVVRPEAYPPWAKEGQFGQFDCVLIYSEEGSDVQMAINFKDLLTKFVILEDGRSPNVCILDRNDNLQHIGSRFKHSDEAMERSTYMFLFITEAFVTDAWAEMQKDECLMESIRQPDKKWCVVPLHTKKKKDLTFRYPYGLRALKGVDISLIVPGKKLDDMNIAKLDRSEIDTYFLENITRMFNQRLGHKLQRERDAQIELEAWIQKEQRRRYQEILKEEHKKKMQRIQEEQEQVNLQKAFMEDEKRVREKAANMKIGIDSTKNVDKPAPFCTTGKTPPAPDSATMIKQLVKMGIPIHEAIYMVESGQSAQGVGGASREQPAGSTLYNITNYGTLQVGRDSQQVINPAGNTQVPDERLDSGVDFSISEREESVLRVDAEATPSTLPSTIHPSTTHPSATHQSATRPLVPSPLTSSPSIESSVSMIPSETSSQGPASTTSSARSQRLQYTSGEPRFDRNLYTHSVQQDVSGQTLSERSSASMESAGLGSTQAGTSAGLGRTPSGTSAGLGSTLAGISAAVGSTPGGISAAVGHSAVGISATVRCTEDSTDADVHSTQYGLSQSQRSQLASPANTDSITAIKVRHNRPIISANYGNHGNRDMGEDAPSSNYDFQSDLVPGAGNVQDQQDIDSGVQSSEH